ncbi:hypothetical protein PFISCL1PPCAC_17187, partial [Pristionchus fissidentatus]
MGSPTIDGRGENESQHEDPLERDQQTLEYAKWASSENRSEMTQKGSAIASITAEPANERTT